MKQYQKVQLIAKNQISGSYAAGCPSKNMGEDCFFYIRQNGTGCKSCERSE